MEPVYTEMEPGYIETEPVYTEMEPGEVSQRPLSHACQFAIRSRVTGL